MERRVDKIVEVVVDNRLRVRAGDVARTVLEDLRDACAHHNPQREALRYQGLAFWTEPPIIRTWIDDGDAWLTLPRGATDRLRAVLGKAGHRARFVDEREAGEGPALEVAHRIVLPDGTEGKLWDYQREAIDVAVARENCLVRAPTGSGKTSLALAIAARLGRPAIVVVWNTKLFDQWVRRIAREYSLDPAEVGVVRGKRQKLMPITVAMQQTLSSTFSKGGGEEVLRYFGCVVVDEVHRAAASTMWAAIDPFPARYRFGLSANEKRKDRKEFLIYDLFRDVAFDIAKKDLVRGGHIVDVEVRVVPTDFRADWYGVPTEEADEQSIDLDRLLDEMTHDPARERVLREVISSERAKGDQILVLSHRREHCLRLHADLVALGWPAALLLGGDDHAERFAADLARLERGDARVAVGTYQSMGTGMDIPNLSVGIAATPIGASRGSFDQAWGRFCRSAKGKSSARFYALWDQHVHPRHVDNYRRWNAKAKLLRDGVWIDLKSRKLRGMNLVLGGV